MKTKEPFVFGRIFWRDGSTIGINLAPAVTAREVVRICQKKFAFDINQSKNKNADISSYKLYSYDVQNDIVTLTELRPDTKLVLLQASWGSSPGTHMFVYFNPEDDPPTIPNWKKPSKIVSLKDLPEPQEISTTPKPLVPVKPEKFRAAPLTTTDRKASLDVQPVVPEKPNHLERHTICEQNEKLCPKPEPLPRNAPKLKHTVSTPFLRNGSNLTPHKSVVQSPLNSNSGILSTSISNHSLKANRFDTPSCVPSVPNENSLSVAVTFLADIDPKSAALYWVNRVLTPVQITVVDFSQFRDGTVLCNLAKVLTGHIPLHAIGWSVNLHTAAVCDLVRNIQYSLIFFMNQGCRFEFSANDIWLVKENAILSFLTEIRNKFFDRIKKKVLFYEKRLLTQTIQFSSQEQKQSEVLQWLRILLRNFKQNISSETDLCSIAVRFLPMIASAITQHNCQCQCSKAIDSKKNSLFLAFPSCSRFFHNADSTKSTNEQTEMIPKVDSCYCCVFHAMKHFEAFGLIMCFSSQSIISDQLLCLKYLCLIEKSFQKQISNLTRVPPLFFDPLEVVPKPFPDEIILTTHKDESEVSTFFDCQNSTTDIIAIINERLSSLNEIWNVFETELEAIDLRVSKQKYLEAQTEKNETLISLSVTSPNPKPGGKTHYRISSIPPPLSQSISKYNESNLVNKNPTELFNFEELFQNNPAYFEQELTDETSESDEIGAAFDVIVARLDEEVFASNSVFKF